MEQPVGEMQPVINNNTICEQKQWVAPSDVLQKIRDKGIVQIESGLSQFEGGFILGDAGGRTVLFERERETDLNCPAVDKKVTGAILATPYRYREYYQSTSYDAPGYIRRQIAKFPERSVYFDSIRQKKGVLPENQEDLPDVLYHSAHVVLTPGHHSVGQPVDQLERLKTTGLIGFEADDRKFYFSTSRYIAFSHGTIGEVDRANHEKLAVEGFGDARKIMLITIDPKVLAEYRDVYIDEESLDWDDEFKKDFVVTGGLPGRAIKKIEIFDQLEIEKP